MVSVNEKGSLTPLCNRQEINKLKKIRREAVAEGCGVGHINSDFAIIIRSYKFDRFSVGGLPPPKPPATI